MSESLQARLALEELARTRRRLHGHVDAREFSNRVGDTLGVDAQQGGVEYEFEFSPAPGETVAIAGRLEARLTARCQRCLENFELALEVPVRLVAATDEGGVPQPPPGWEVSEHGMRPRLIDLVEEELLLALPLAPRHVDADCRGSLPETPDGSLRRPFVGLDRQLGGGEGE